MNKVKDNADNVLELIDALIKAPFSDYATKNNFAPNTASSSHAANLPKKIPSSLNQNLKYCTFSPTEFTTENFLNINNGSVVKKLDKSKFIDESEDQNYMKLYNESLTSEDKPITQIKYNYPIQVTDSNSVTDYNMQVNDSIKPILKKNIKKRHNKLSANQLAKQPAKQPANQPDKKSKQIEEIVHNNTNNLEKDFSNDFIEMYGGENTVENIPFNTKPDTQVKKNKTKLEKQKDIEKIIEFNQNLREKWEQTKKIYKENEILKNKVESTVPDPTHKLINISENITKIINNLPIDKLDKLQKSKNITQADIEEKYEILVNLINYLIIMIDFLNKLIESTFKIFHQKIIVNTTGNSLIINIKNYYETLIDFLVKKIGEKTLRNTAINTEVNMTEVKTVAENKSLEKVWQDYQKENNFDKKQKMLVSYLQKNNENALKE